MNKNVFYFKLYKILFLTMLTDPVFVLYAYSAGLSANQIYLLTSLQTVWIVLLELPTGVISDLFGCKSSILLGIICYILSDIILLAAPSFPGFVVSVLFLSLYKVFVSGADETYLYLALEHKDSYTKTAGMLDSVNFILTAFVSIGVGYLYSLNKRYPFLLSIVLCGISFLPAAKLENIRETDKDIKTVRKLCGEFYSNIRNGLRISFTSRTLRWFFLYSAVVGFALVALSETYQLFFLQHDIPVEYFGWIYFVLYIISSLSSKTAYYFKRFSVQNVFMVLLGMLVLTSFLMAWPCQYLIPVIILPRIVIGIYPAMLKEYINKEITVDRATIFSIRSLLSRFPQIVLLPVIGSMIDKSGIHAALLLLSVILLLFAGVLKYSRKKSN